jgi:hypothetical protein
LEQQEKGRVVGGRLFASYQHRLHSGSLTVDDVSKVPNGLDFRRAYLDFSPVLSLGAWGGNFTGLWLEGKLDLRPAWYHDYSPDNNFFSKVDITYDILNKGIFAWNSKSINFFLGRDKTHWGNPRGSTLYPSGLLPCLDSVKLNVPLGPFTLDYMLAADIPKKALYDIDNAPAHLSGTGYSDIPGDYFGFRNEKTPSIVAVVSHRFQWNFGSLKTGIGGTVVYARSNNAYSLTDFIPLMVYHNADVAPNNLNMVIDLSWAFYPGFTFSFMAGFDDISAKTFGLNDGPTPTIPGIIAQLEYSRSDKNRFMYLLAEGGYTHYLWGNFAYEDKVNGEWAGVYLARAIYRYAPNQDGIILPLTSPYGPGTIWGRFLLDLSFPEKHITTGAELLVLTKNKDVNLIDTKYFSSDTTKDSQRIWYVSLDLPFRYTYKKWEFSAKPAIILKNMIPSFECTVGIRFIIEGEGLP